MKYNDKELKEMVLKALYDAGYYTERWREEGGKDAREDKGYYNGVKDALLRVYTVENFNNAQEAITAYNNGVNAYNDRHE